MRATLLVTAPTVLFALASAIRTNLMTNL